MRRAGRPGEPGDAWEDDFVLLADAFTTGYHAAAVIDVAPGDSVAVFGAGAIGLSAAYAARLRGAARVYVVDAIAERLNKAEQLGAVPIDFLHADPVEQIKEGQAQWRSGSAFRQEVPLGGVTCAIDAIGFQARSKADYRREDPLWVTAAIAVHRGKHNMADYATLIHPTSSNFRRLSGRAAEIPNLV